MSLVLSGSLILILASSGSGNDSERTVRMVIEEVTNARVSGNVDHMMLWVADDAMLESFAGKMLTKSQYTAAVRQRLVEAAGKPEVSLRYRIIKVEFRDTRNAEALIEQNTYYNPDGVQGFQTKRVENNRFVWKLELRGEKWMILHQKWLRQ